MLTAIQIREGLFFVSWDTSNSSPIATLDRRVPNNTPLTPTITGQVENLPEIFRSCKLYYKIEEGNCGVLEMRTVISKGMQPGKLETILVQAIQNGVHQTMTLMQSTWTTRWNNCERKFSCDCDFHECYPDTPDYYFSCGQRYKIIESFVILIDLKSGPSISPPKGAKHVLENVLNLWNTKILSDVTFNCKNNSIKAHTLIVASGSPVLAAMFQHNFTENQKKIVEIQDIEANVIEELLCFIYTGNFSTSNVDVAQILVAADKYAVETLKEECSIHLAANLTVQNALQYLVLSHLHNSPVLYEKALNFITRKKNAKTICSRKDWMEVIKNYPELCFRITQLLVGA